MGHLLQVLPVPCLLRLQLRKEVQGVGQVKIVDLRQRKKEAGVSIVANALRQQLLPSEAGRDVLGSALQVSALSRLLEHVHQCTNPI